MKWNELFNIEQIPPIEDIRTYIGEAKLIWDELVTYIDKTYNAKRQLDYSKDSLQPGWNVKYKKTEKPFAPFIQWKVILLLLLL